MLHDVVFNDGFAFAETAQPQRGNIERMSPAIKNLFSQKKPAGRAMHKAVTGEPIDDIETFYFGHVAQEGVCVGTDLIETCPPAAEANVFEQRHPSHRRLEMDQLPFAVNLLIEAGWFNLYWTCL